MTSRSEPRGAAGPDTGRGAELGQVVPHTEASRNTQVAERVGAENGPESRAAPRCRLCSPPDL